MFSIGTSKRQTGAENHTKNGGFRVSFILYKYFYYSNHGLLFNFISFYRGHEVFVTLWGRYAEEIVAYVSKHHGHFVMIIQLAKFKNIRRMYLP